MYKKLGFNNDNDNETIFIVTPCSNEPYGYIVCHRGTHIQLVRRHSTTSSRTAAPKVPLSTTQLEDDSQETVL